MYTSKSYSLFRLFQVFFLGCLIISSFQVSEVWGQGSCSTVYTLNSDFDQGNLVNVNHDTPNQLELNAQTAPPPFIWVACSQRGTVVRIDVANGNIIGEYKTAPDGRSKNPSRTTVDLYGNVWVGNRDEASSIKIDGVTLPRGSVVKIGVTIGGTRCDADGTPNSSGDYLKPPFTFNTCVDRDGDGLIKTSRGLGDIRSWSNADGVDNDGGVETADDEAILIFSRTTATTVRHVSIDANNDVWVGGHTTSAPSKFNKLNGNTGAILATYPSSGNASCGGYGGLIDGNGILWSASLNQYALFRYDIASTTSTCISLGRYSYGLGIDLDGNIWNSNWTHNTITKISPSGVIQPGFPKSFSGANGCRGVAVTSDNNIWVANSYGNSVSRLDNDGNLRKTIPVGNHPTGVAVDANGKVWATNLNSSTVSRIDPDAGGDELGAVDLTVGLGSGAGPYNYSDMTGAVAIGVTSLQGTWNVVKNSGTANTDWGKVSWTETLPTGTDIKIEVRAANTQAGLASETFVEVTNGDSFCGTGVSGQYVEIRATLSRQPNISSTPVLYDLTLELCDDTAPVITCPSNIEQNTDEGSCSTVVTWDISATDNCDNNPTIVCTPASGSTFDIGTTTVNCVATDESGNESSCSFDVTVVDDENPSVSVLLDPTELWPPNHKMVTITATVTTSDNCSGYSYVLESITSNEPDDGLGDGDTEDDIQNEDIGTDDLSFDLRAERAGMGDGRTYTITYKVTDGSGNETIGTATVSVPKSRRKISIDDDFVDSEVQIRQNQPNPFSESTEIQYYVPQTGFAVLRLTDIYGRVVKNLVSYDVSSGWNSLILDGSKLSNGVYLLILESNNQIAVKVIHKTN